MKRKGLVSLCFCFACAVATLSAQQAYYLPQVANGQFPGGSIRTTFVLFNPSSETATATLNLTRDDAGPLVVTIPGLGTDSEFAISLAPGATRILQSDGLGDLTAGAATIVADLPVGVHAIFSIAGVSGNFLTEAGVGSSPALRHFFLPVDATGDFDTGVALFNCGTQAATATLRLIDTEGAEVSSPTELTLKAGEHLAKFVAGELFSSVPGFRGSLEVIGTAPLCPLTLRQNASPLSFTTLPVVSADSTHTEFNLPQVADGPFPGGSIRTTFLVFNITSSPATVELSLSKDDGSAFAVTLPGQGTASSFSLNLAAGASAFLQTDGSGTLSTGAASVTSDIPVGVAAIFSILDPEGGFLTEAGVGDSPNLKRFQIPVDISPSFSTGLAFFNPGTQPASLDLLLLSENGTVTSSASPIQLEAQHHLAKFVGELFPGITDFQGSLVVTASREVSALTLRQNAVPLNFTTLPVVPRENSFPSSAELISEALSEGQIDDEQALLYEVFAAFGDSRLPAQYRGDDSGVYESDILDQVATQLDSLSPQARETLLTFFVPPYYEGSWFDLPHRSDANAVGRAAPTDAPPCAPDKRCPVSPDWDFTDSANGKTRVWYLKAKAADRSKAIDLAQAIDNLIWPKLTDLMQREPFSDAGESNNGGDGRVDIAIVPLGNVKGQTWNYVPGCEDEPVYILIADNLSRDDTLAAGAHELMHAIQWTYDVDAFCLKPEYKWLMESTATWAIDYVYPGNNLEHGFAQDFLGVPQKSLDDDPEGRHPYGAYLFPFYLARGFSPQWIRSIWEATGQNQSLEAVEAGLQTAGSTKLEDRWPEFVLRNWNQEPVDQYKTWDGLTQGVMPVQGLSISLSGIEDDKISLDMKLPHLSSQYYSFEFANQDVRSVAFYNGLTFKLSEQDLEGSGIQTPVLEPLTEEQRRGASVQALVKLNGQDWQQMDWTGSPIQVFCRDKADERLDQLVLIFSNSEHRTDGPNYDSLEPRGDKPALWVSNMGCWMWQGTAEWTETSGGITESAAATVTWEPWILPGGGLPASSQSPLGDVKVAFPSYAYQLKHASLDWSISGVSGNCSVSGNAEGLTVGNTLGNALITYNYATRGDFHRGFMMEGFDDFLNPLQVTEHWVCPPDEGGSFDVPRELGFYLDLDPFEDGNQSRVKKDGIAIDVTDPDTGAIVRFRALRQP